MEEKIEFIQANKLCLFDLVEYHESSVVSRTLINKNSGNITIFSFDKGQGLSEHTTSYDALVYLIEGEAEVTIANKTHLLSKGEIILMPAKTPHSIMAIKKFKMLLIMI